MPSLTLSQCNDFTLSNSDVDQCYCMMMYDPFECCQLAYIFYEVIFPICPMTFTYLFRFFGAI